VPGLPLAWSGSTRYEMSRTDLVPLGLVPYSMDRMDCTEV
jgi:hypothetical protein